MFRGSSGFGKNRHRIPVGFGQFSQAEILSRRLGDQAKPLGPTAAPGQRQFL